MMSGVAGSGRESVAGALRQYAAQKRGTFEPATPGEAFDERQMLILAESREGNTTVFYPSDFLDWDDASNFLSVTLKTPVLSLHVHDGDFWMYILFANGQPIDRFNPVPDYFGEDQDESAWSGNASLLARTWPNVTEAQVANYLQRWETEDDAGGKAYPDDEYETGVDWQIVDFMRKVGLIYPIDDQGGVTGSMYRFQVRR